ncbi:MAG: UMF1 family MFS transporter [Flavobacterium sp.]
MSQTSEPLSLAGTPAASPLGYYSWTFGQAARDPLYIMVIIYIFFPYFSNVVVGDPVRGQALIGYLNAGAGLFMALTVPFMGAIADKIGKRKPWILGSHILMSLIAFSLWWILPAGAGVGVGLGFGLLLILLIAFGYAEVFHNAMLPSVTPIDKAGVVSGLAFSLGNMCAIGLLVFVLIAFALPGTLDWRFLPDAPLFGIDKELHEHDRIVGPLGGLWLLLASLPLFLFTPDGIASNNPVIASVRHGLKDVVNTIKQLKHYSNIATYLLSRMFFNDGMAGVLVFNGVYASATFGWDTTALLLLGIFTSTSAMMGAYLGGIVDDKLGSIKTLKIAIGMTTLILIGLVSMQPDTIFFIVLVSTEPVWSSPYFNTIAELTYLLMFQVFAVFFVTGLSASRTLMAKISPPEMATQFFALYSLSGTVTAFLAPLLVGITTAFFQSQRAGFASLILLMVIGAAMLFLVKEERSTVAPDLMTEKLKHL